ncbi:MAG: dihydrofolate reductase family protein [Candidatus Bathyarchaeia archaeon]
MRTIVMAMQMTLDGYSAGPNDEMDWLPPFNDVEIWKDLQEEMWNQLNQADAFLLGRVTYQIWEKYWPAAATNLNSTENDLRFSRFADATQKIVFSKTLQRVEWKNTKLIKDNITEEVQKLKEQPGKNIVLAGGAGLAQTFTKLGLIDEYRITVHPVILGRGKLLFKDLNVRQKLKLAGTKTFRSGAVEFIYQCT